MGDDKRKNQIENLKFVIAILFGTLLFYFGLLLVESPGSYWFGWIIGLFTCVILKVISKINKEEKRCQKK